MLLLFLGGLGVHRFYLGFNNLAIAQLVCFIIGILTVWIGIGILPLLFTGIVAFIDLFLTVGLTERANATIEQHILTSLPVAVGA